MGQCIVCNTELAVGHKANARYCSPGCRQNAYRTRRTPEARARAAALSKLRHAKWLRENPDRARENMRRWQAKNREKTRANSRRFHHEHPDWARGKVLKRYGLSLDDYAAMLAEQGGVCALCRQPETSRHQSGEIRRLAVDHDHVTGAVRGLLCHDCNFGIANFRDDPDRLSAAIDYLRRQPA